MRLGTTLLGATVATALSGCECGKNPIKERLQEIVAVFPEVGNVIITDKEVGVRATISRDRDGIVIGYKIETLMGEDKNPLPAFSHKKVRAIIDNDLQTDGCSLSAVEFEDGTLKDVSCKPLNDHQDSIGFSQTFFNQQSLRPVLDTESQKNTQHADVEKNNFGK